MARPAKTREQLRNSDASFNILIHLTALVAIFVCAYPIYYTIIASISDPNAVITGKVLLWPVNLTWDSYRSVLRYALVWTGYKNTLLYTTAGTVWNLFLLIPASYAMAKGVLNRRARSVSPKLTIYSSFGTRWPSMQFCEIDSISVPE